MPSGFPVESRDVNSYVKDLTQHLARVYDTVHRIKKETAERDEVSAEGRVGYELNPGDPVLVKRTGDRQGPTRFRERTYPGIFVVKRKISPAAFEVEDLVDKTYSPPFTQPLNAERLIKLDMPELELRPGQPKRLEMRMKETQPWGEYTVERFGLDGRVSLRTPGGSAQWVDLSKCEYRWLQ